MSKSISQYFKRIFDDYFVLVQVNPDDFSGIELIVHLYWVLRLGPAG